MRGGAAQPADPLMRDPALAEALADPMGFSRLSDEDVRAMRAARRHRLGTAGAVALLLAIGAGGWRAAGWGLGGWGQSSVAPTSEHYETARGQRATVQLADGSTVELNGATSIDVTMAGDRRSVALRQGEAFFDVAHDPARPFTVQADGSSARVLGTAFDLDLIHGQVDLAVYRGAVRFGGGAADPHPQVVQAGWRSRYRDGGATAPSRFDPNRQDWRQGWIDTDGMRLANLVDALNRQGGPLVIAPTGTLADMPIAGRFRLDDPAVLLGAIGGAYGFGVRHEGDRLRLEPVA